MPRAHALMLWALPLLSIMRSRCSRAMVSASKAYSDSNAKADCFFCAVGMEDIHMQHATPPDNKDPNAPWYHMPANGLGEAPFMTYH